MFSLQVGDSFYFLVHSNPLTSELSLSNILVGSPARRFQLRYSGSKSVKRFVPSEYGSAYEEK